MKNPTKGDLCSLASHLPPKFLLCGKQSTTSKKTISLFTALLVTCISFAQTILIGFEGESNFVSRAKADGRFEVPTTPGAMWYKQSTNTLEPVTDPIGEGISKADDRSAAPAFAKRMKELFPNQSIIIVPSAVGGSRISPWSKGQSLYQRAKTMWDNAIAYCNANGIAISHKYIAWEQGGNDVAALETDGYYVALNQLTNDFISDYGAEKVFGIRIGYDPNYAPAIEAEKIMKAHKLVNFNNPNYIVATNAPATFTLQNEKMQGDGVHWTLKGQNEVGADLAEAINLYQNTGTKASLTEPVASLQSVTTGYINLSPVWSYEFSNNLAELNNNSSMRFAFRDWITPYSLDYDAEGIIIHRNSGLKISRPFSYNTFSIEMRFKINDSQSASAIIGNGTGDHYDKLVLYQNSANSTANITMGTATEHNSWDLTNINFTAFHTLKITQANGVLKLFIDGVPKGDKVSNGVFTMDRIGMGADSHTFDTEGTIDYFRIKNTVDNISALPLKFKSFKATNIK